MRGDPETINKTCQEFWDRATPSWNKEMHNEAELDLKNELKLAVEELWEDMIAEGIDIEEAMRMYLGRRG